MMTSGVSNRISRFVDLHFHYNFEDMLSGNKRELPEFQVEFRHVRIIVLGYVAVLMISGVIFLWELTRNAF